MLKLNQSLEANAVLSAKGSRSFNGGLWYKGKIQLSHSIIGGTIQGRYIITESNLDSRILSKGNEQHSYMIP